MSVPAPKRRRDWVGRRVLLIEGISNGWGRIPAGTIMNVTGTQPVNRNRDLGGLTLESDSCPCCGMRSRISRVHDREVQLLPVKAMEDAS